MAAGLTASRSGIAAIAFRPFEARPQGATVGSGHRRQAAKSSCVDSVTVPAIMDRGPAGTCTGITSYTYIQTISR